MRRAVAVGNLVKVAGSKALDRHAALRARPVSVRSGGGRGFWVRAMAFVGALATALVVLASLGAVAQAQKSIGGFIGDFEGGGVTLGGEFSAARDVAVNMSGAGAADPGDVYVSEVNGRRVQVLDADGNFKFMFGRDVVAAGGAGDVGDAFEVCTVAADCKQGSIGTSTDGPGGEFNVIQGLAVDQASGRVYVQERATSASAGNRRVQEFSAGGEFLRAWGWDVVASGPSNNGGFEVCVAADGDVCQAATASGAAGGQFASSTTNSNAIAVSPIDGHVFVGDPANRRVLEFDPAAAGAAVFVRGWGWDVDKTTVDNRFETCVASCGAGVASTPAHANGAFTTTSPLHLAIDSQGVVYASDAAPTTSSQRVLRFDASPAPGAGDATSALLDALGSPPLLSSGTTPTLGLEIDADTDAGGPDEESLLVTRDPGTPTTDPIVVQELDIPTGAGETPADAVTEVVRHTFGTVQGSLFGLGVNSQNGFIFLPGSYVVSGTVRSGMFVLSAVSGTPVVSALPPTVIGSEEVTLAGALDPRGIASYQFEIAEGGGAFEAVGTRVYVSGEVSEPISQQITGLEPNTFYRFRIRVTKQTGVTTTVAVDSNEQIFLTRAKAPDVTTLGTAERTATGVQLRGLVDPNGSATTYRFEYGPDGGSFDRHVPIPDGQVGSGQGDQMVTQTLSGLLPNTAYRYRVVAANSEGTTIGNAVGFTTTAAGTARPSLGARAFELVSPADKISGAGVGSWYDGPGTATFAGVAAYEGERFAAEAQYGAVLLNGAQAYASDWAFADRVSDQQGWVSHSPITHAASGPVDLRFIDIHAANPSLSRVSFRDAGTLRPFPAMADWPDMGVSLISDWQGRWEIFGPTDLSQLEDVSGSVGRVSEIAFSADGSAVVGASAKIRGLGGPGDPTADLPPESILGNAPHNIWLGDLSSGPANSLEGTGQRVLVNACSAATEIPSVDGAGELQPQGCVAGGLVSDRGAVLQASGAGSAEQRTPLENVVSRDGSRVFFMSPDMQVPGVPYPSRPSTSCTGTGTATVCPPQLFVRQRRPDGSVAVEWISRSRSQDLGGGRYGGAMIPGQDAALLGAALFEGASEDGDKVFFRTNSPLTPDDPNGGGQVAGGVRDGAANGNSWDLYMYDLPDDPGADPAAGTLTRVSAGPTGAGDGNGLQELSGGGVLSQAMMRAVAADGSRAYFVTAAPLPGVAAPSSGTITSPGGTVTTTHQSNLYSYDANAPVGDRWRFVARLPRAVGDSPAACATTGVGRRSVLSGFNKSNPGLVGFFNNLVSNPSCVSASRDGEFVTFFTDGRLTADDPDAVSGDIYAYDASADDLTRITAVGDGVGGAYPCGTGGIPLATPCYGDGGFRAEQRAFNPLLGLATDPQHAGDRIAFFQSRSRLVAADTDQAYDVYQWRNGELSLLTPGDSGVDDGQMYVGNDRSGRNVYFATRDRLSWQDFDAVLDVYTARIDGGIAQPALPAICPAIAGGCQIGGGAAVVEAAPQSAGSRPGGDVAARPRATLSIAPLGAEARRRAARTGTLRVRVRAATAGRVTVTVKARVAGRVRRVGRARARLSGPGAVTVRLRLASRAMRVLRRGGRLRVALTVSQQGARAQSTVAVLERRRSR
jgi:hypothetical protein